MSRVAILTALVAAAVFAVPVRAAADRPNILFIMSDDHAAHAISAYGSVITQRMACG
jgi:N-acetylglucosamine-6-sulfatase